MDSRGRVVIPAFVRKKLRIRANDTIVLELCFADDISQKRKGGEKNV
jgi:AbrB family looped-hinge helix DNA binding protein